jgi:hypothetical protein
MYTYSTPTHRPATGLGALVGIGNYVFSGLSAADDIVGAPLPTTEIVPSATSQVVDVVVPPEGSAVDVTIPPDTTVPALTEAEIDQKRFGYFGSMSASTGVQVMSISGGVAISIIALFLGMKVGKATRVSTKEIVAASAIAAASAFLGILAIKTFR